MLSNEKLSALVDRVAEELPSVKRLRFHTRMPVTLPSRVNEGLLSAIVRPGNFRTFVVAHFNHPRELTPEAKKATDALADRGIILLNQAVLLRGVNDSAETLRTLFVGLGTMGVLPYYLHHCDLVAGAEHFRLPLREGRAIMAELRENYRAIYCRSTYSTCRAGWENSRGRSFVESENNGEYLLRGREGEQIPYRDVETILH